MTTEILARLKSMVTAYWMMSAVSVRISSVSADRHSKAIEVLSGPAPVSIPAAICSRRSFNCCDGTVTVPPDRCNAAATDAIPTYKATATLFQTIVKPYQSQTMPNQSTVVGERHVWLSGLLPAAEYTLYT